MLEIKSFTNNPFAENTYLLYDETKEGVLIDPGVYNKEEQDTVKQVIDSLDLRIVAVWNTHAHIDHTFGWDWASQTFNVPIYVHPKEHSLVEGLEQLAKQYQVQFSAPKSSSIHYTDAAEWRFGNQTFEMRFCPGHSPGHMVFHHKESAVCLVGDVIFRESMGRTDLPLSNHEDLMRSIPREIFTLPSETVLYTGHGVPTTVAHEKTNNPFF